ncbi:Cof-type HAD-IIB family hydrolase [Ligilactobacillus sp. LYQ112]|uniref:Cof-type HAD-IIB family hydrolase n=1 Tax=unclassified Ligilactobacillus TaxID=2767920 RepID=UPI00385536C1
MTIKLVASDIDNTLLTPDKKLTARTIAAIHAARKQGVHVVLCTGRPLTGVAPLLEQLGLTSASDYVITLNGAQVQRATGEQLFASTIPLSEYQQLVPYFTRIGINMHMVTLDSNVYVHQPDVGYYTVFDTYHTKMHLHVIPLNQLPADIQIAKYMMADEPAKIDAAIRQLPTVITKHFYCVRSERFFYELLNKQATKGNAVIALADHLAVTADEVMTLGDENNDLPMITQAGLGVAMGNANPQVKAAAQAVTTDNNHDGVARAIEKYVLTPSKTDHSASGKDR